MIIDGNEYFKARRALNGDKVSMVELIDHYVKVKDDKIKMCEFFEMLVEHHPAECEKLFLEITTDSLDYEDMLRLIAWTYYHDIGNDYEAGRWFIKYFDYIDHKFSHLSVEEKEQKKQECGMYEPMKAKKYLDENKYRFWLKWEREHFKNLPLDK